MLRPRHPEDPLRSPPTLVIAIFVRATFVFGGCRECHPMRSAGVLCHPRLADPSNEALEPFGVA